MSGRQFRANLSAAILSVFLATTFSAPVYAQACREQTVIMLSASWCGFCRKARNFFNAHDVAFTEIDVELTSHSDIQRLYRQNGVPVIFIGSDQVAGFDETRLRDLLCIEE